MDKAGPLQPVLEPILRSVLGVVVDMKVDFEVDMFWNRVNGQRVIQVSLCLSLCLCLSFSLSRSLSRALPLALSIYLSIYLCLSPPSHSLSARLPLQAHAPPQPPVIEHPDTGLPTWFCNIHSHSAMLRDERDGVLPETTGASRVLCMM